MKKLFLIFVTVFLNFFMFSCSSDDIIESEAVEEVSPQACCGNEGDIPPPPPSGGD